VVQSFVHDGGLPAPEVTLHDPGTTIAGRAWFVMELLPGRPATDGVDLWSMARDARATVRELPALAASVHLSVHRLDPQPLVDRFGTQATLERWWTSLSSVEGKGRSALGPALDWLQANVPTPRAPCVLCHGDTWGGNLLLDDDGGVTGIIDWSVATVGEPALEVGFLRMALSLAPVGLPRPIQHLVQRMGRRVARTYQACYETGSGADLGSIPYYEALRCGIELQNVVDFRTAAAGVATYDAPRPSWDSIGGDMVDYFEARTGVRLQIPAPVS
jgi:aminoglycoside phosphotransferase (APT) family kinase protein